MGSPIAWMASPAATPRGGSPSCATAASASFGAAGLILLCLLAVTALAALSACRSRLRVLVLAPVVGRLAPLLAGAWLAPATPGQGLGAAFARRPVALGGSRSRGRRRRAGRVAAGDVGLAVAAAAWRLALLAAGVRGAPPRRGDRRRAGRRRGGGRAGNPARRGGGRAPAGGSERAPPCTWSATAAWWARRPAGSSAISTCPSRRSASAQVDALVAPAEAPSPSTRSTAAISSAPGTAPRSWPRPTRSPPSGSGPPRVRDGGWDGLTAEQIRARDAARVRGVDGRRGRASSSPAARACRTWSRARWPAFEAHGGAARGRHDRGGGARREQPRRSSATRSGSAPSGCSRWARTTRRSPCSCGPGTLHPARPESPGGPDRPPETEDRRDEAAAPLG